MSGFWPIERCVRLAPVTGAFTGAAHAGAIPSPAAATPMKRHDERHSDRPSAECAWLWLATQLPPRAANRPSPGNRLTVEHVNPTSLGDGARQASAAGAPIAKESANRSRVLPPLS